MRTMVFVIIFVCFAASATCGETQDGVATSESQTRLTTSQSPSLGHGTINITLSNGADLVAVTDTMITWANGQHTPSGAKLYQVDDRTICMIAGFYLGGGPQNLAAFAALIPQLMNDYVTKVSNGSVNGHNAIDFDSKANGLIRHFVFRLTAHLQSLVTDSPGFDINDPNLVLYLTLAGFDLDGKLKVADITLAPTRNAHGVSYETIARPNGPSPAKCEAAGVVSPLRARTFERTEGVVVHTLAKEFFCDVAGVPEVAERLLEYPFISVGHPGIEEYSRIRKAGGALNQDQLRSLALDLEEETADDQRLHQTFLVGGDPQTAILSNGRVVDAPPSPHVPENVGSSLSNTQGNGSTWDCTGSGGQQYAISTGGKPLPSLLVLRAGGTLQARIQNCFQDIDGFIFHDSVFNDSTLVYSGNGPLLFGPNNSVIHSRLVLGPSVDIESPDVKRLVCGFPWTSVSKGETKIETNCNS
jgi:hypothetical protein